MNGKRNRTVWFGSGLGVGLLLGLALSAVLGLGHDLSQPAAVGSSSEALPVPSSSGAASSQAHCDLGVVVAGQAVDVAAQTEGIVEAVAVEVGDSVEAGSVLARVDVRLLQQDLVAEQAALAAARAEAGRRRIGVQRAEAESARRRLLAEVVSQEEIARADAELAEERALVVVADAEVERLVARIERLGTVLGRADLRAPFDGRIATRYLDPGARAAIGTPIVRLISDQDLQIRFAASPDRAARLTAGTPVWVEIPERGLRTPAIVEQVAPEIDAASRKVFVEARPDSVNALAQLRAGDLVRVTVDDLPCTNL